MACGLEMYNKNSDHKAGLSSCAATPMSPRISFSNDFVESNHSQYQHHTTTIRSGTSREAPPPPPPSSDFEFSVTNYSMMSADELFFKGRLLPFKDSCTKTTLRDELLVDDEDDDDVSMRPPRGAVRLKELLGLRKSHIRSKKSNKNDGFVEKRPGLVLDQEAHRGNTSLNNGGTSCKDMELGM
ncbi:uncharacterized protein LOC132286010 isoform X2 [Cornus florida]|uniref:uncharacterized protein LOC132286010 isoform X2 n=1 Tax=Cornus florida TaxID=4283 RepID=UPI0028988F40|nr:uncharacterized protein LOC132286010 isoform X2 [Cornus florida]